MSLGRLRMEQRTMNNENILTTGDRLTIETIAEFIGRLRKGLDAATTVFLKFDPQMEMDITALQALCSACKTAAAEGKQLIPRGSPPQALLDLVVAAGAESHEGCSIDTTSCFRQFGGTNKWAN